MQAVEVKLSDLRPNDGQVKGLPKNPRYIKDSKFELLVKSIEEDPEMLELREIIAVRHKKELVVICGNMRLKAMEQAGFKTAPTKILKESTPIEKLKRYSIKDNVPFGTWDMDDLANDWETDALNDWGMDLWNVTAYEPNLSPDINWGKVDDEAFNNIDLSDLAPNLELAEMIDLKCPSCGHEYHIKK